MKPKFSSKPVLLPFFIIDPIVSIIAFFAVVLAAVAFFGEHRDIWYVLPLAALVVGVLGGFVGLQIIPLLLKRIGIELPAEKENLIVTSDD